MQTMSDISKIKSDARKYYVLVQKALALMQTKGQTKLTYEASKIIKFISNYDEMTGTVRFRRCACESNTDNM